MSRLLSLVLWWTLVYMCPFEFWWPLFLYACFSFWKSEAAFMEYSSKPQGLSSTFVLCCVLSRSVMSNSWWLHGLWPARLLCSWDSPGKNTGVGCHSLLQEIFLTQGLNWGLLHCWRILYCLSHQGSPVLCVNFYIYYFWGFHKYFPAVSEAGVTSVHVSLHVYMCVLVCMCAHMYKSTCRYGIVMSGTVSRLYAKSGNILIHSGISRLTSVLGKLWWIWCKLGWFCGSASWCQAVLEPCRWLLISPRACQLAKRYVY